VAALRSAGESRVGSTPTSRTSLLLAPGLEGGYCTRDSFTESLQAKPTKEASLVGKRAAETRRRREYGHQVVANLIRGTATAGTENRGSRSSPTPGGARWVIQAHITAWCIPRGHPNWGHATSWCVGDSRARFDRTNPRLRHLRSWSRARSLRRVWRAFVITRTVVYINTLGCVLARWTVAGPWELPPSSTTRFHRRPSRGGAGAHRTQPTTPCLVLLDSCPALWREALEDQGSMRRS